MAPFPARVHVLLARRAPVGVVIRRGPAKSVCTLLWDRRRDSFELGQWLKGRIYERRCDLSPDGEFLIYFALNGRWESETRGSWTAISRPPYLKAVVLYPKGDGWHGGGLFTGPRRYWLNGGHAHPPLQHTPALRRDDAYVPIGGVGGECLSLYYPRLLRDGWLQRAPLRDVLGSSLHVFERPLPGGWILRKLSHVEYNAPTGHGPYWDEHVLLRPAAGIKLPFPAWEWADRDGDRLVWAEHGRLNAALLDDAGLVEQRMLIDLTPLQFEQRVAPY